MERRDIGPFGGRLTKGKAKGENEIEMGDKCTTTEIRVVLYVCFDVSCDSLYPSGELLSGITPI